MENDDLTTTPVLQQYSKEKNNLGHLISRTVFTQYLHGHMREIENLPLQSLLRGSQYK
jgi:hypothetical protein